MVGLGDKLAGRKAILGTSDGAEDDDWRVRAARQGPQTLAGRAKFAVVTLGVEHDQIGPVKIG